MRVARCLYCSGKKLERVASRSDDIDILECAECKLMMADSLNRDAAHHYAKRHSEIKGGSDPRHDDYQSLPAANEAGKFAFASLYSAGNKHVDLGSADGLLMEVFKNEGYTSEGLESSEHTSEVAVKKGLTVTVTDFHSFPKNMKGVNVITAYDILEYSDQPGLVLKNVYESLAKDGVFVFSTPSIKDKGLLEYWFNHSLEQRVYYTGESLAKMLGDTFGEDNYGFTEEIVNGVAKFWGFGKKGDASREKETLTVLRTGGVPATPADAYYFSLFYNQVSKFEQSSQLIHSYKEQWGGSRWAEAIFYYHYAQGGFTKALNEVRALKTSVLAERGVFWQAYAYAEHIASTLRLETRQTELQKEIMSLKEQAFRLRDELHGLTHSRVLGRIIKARRFIGDSVVPGVKALPRNIVSLPVYYAKEAVIAVIPKKTTRQIVELKQKMRGTVSSALKTSMVVQTQVQNTVLEDGGVLISIVIPYFNRAQTINDTLSSLENQTFKGFEVIVVDDGSTEKISQIAFSELPSRHPTLNLHLLQQENLGVAQARNNGIEQADGRYIVCLDSDDILTNTYVEKCVLVLETHPDISLVTTDREHFGAVNEIYAVADYDPMKLYHDNMVTTAAAFRKDAWLRAGGYKSGIGYEDWEFWLSLAENGDWGVTLHEPLFRYRVELQSRFQDDKNKHWEALKTVRTLHPGYKQKIKMLMKKKQSESIAVTSESALCNLSSANDYEINDPKPSVLIAIPWMTFGGAETLIYNYCREIKMNFNLSFITGLPSLNEWQYKFTEITERIYHLPQLVGKDLYFEFISNYITINKIDILHIIHSGYMFDMLPKLKELHPNLKVSVTMFNDRVREYVSKSIEQQDNIDTFNTDSEIAAKSFRAKFTNDLMVRVIPNGIDCYHEFNPTLFNRDEVRSSLKLGSGDKAVFFIGRLSEEKNPDVFIEIAKTVLNGKNGSRAKFFIIGDGPMKKEIEHAIHTAHQSDITYLGYKSEVAKYLSAADIFVLPSSVEGFPLSILEAMSMRVAVIASRVGAVPDVIKDGKNGYVIEPGSILEGAEKVELLLDDVVLRAICKQNREDVEQKYSNKKLGASYQKLYNEALQ